MVEGGLFGPASCIGMLLQAGADPNSLGRDDWTPLHLAAYFGRFECIDMLLKAGADPASLTNTGRTPADIASEENYDEIAPFLRNLAQSASESAEIEEATSGSRMEEGRLEGRSPSARRMSL